MNYTTAASLPRNTLSDDDTLDIHVINGVMIKIESLNTPMLFLETLIDRGFLTDKSFADAKKRCSIRAEQKERAAEKERAEMAKKVYSENAADSMFWRLYNRKQSDPLSLPMWARERPLTELENYLGELKARPTFYNSLFKNNDIGGAIEMLEKLIEKKRAHTL